MKIMHRKVVHLLVFAISTSPKIHFVCVFLDPNTRKQFCICIIYILLGRLKVPKEDEDNAYAKLFMCLGGGGQETHQESELWEMWKWQIGKKAVYLAVHVVC